MSRLRRRTLLAGAALVLVTLLAYCRVTQAGFIWDDDDYVVANTNLRSLQGLGRIWSDIRAAPQYYPMVHTTFWLEYQLWELNPLGYHLVNVLLHAVVALLWWRLLALLGVPGAWWAGALFAVHPVHVESVAWITERKNVLSGVFYLVAFIALLRFRLAQPAESVRRWAAYALSLVAFTGALLSKTVTASLPAAALLVLWWKEKLRARDLLYLSPFFAVGLAMSSLTVSLELSHVGAEGTMWDLSLVERFLIAGRALWFYAAKLAWPHPLAFFYLRWPVDPGQWWQFVFPLAALFVATALFLARRRLGRGPLTGVLFFAGTLFPALGFFNVYPFRYSWVADHFQYLASMGLIALFVAVARHQIDRRPAAIRRGATLMAVALLAVLGLLTWRQSGIYRDLETLWLDTIAKNENAWMAHTNLGSLYEETAGGSLGATRDIYARKAADHYRQAVTIAERTDLAAGEPYNNYARVLDFMGRTSEAIRPYRVAIEHEPERALYHHNLGLALLKLDRLAEAEEALRRAIALSPESPLIRGDLGILLTRQNRLEEAEEQFRIALRSDPAGASVYYNASILQDQRGDRARAVELLRRAVDLEPDYSKARYRLGLQLFVGGRRREALTHLAAAVDLEPTDPEMRFRYGMALRSEGDPVAGRNQLKRAAALARDQGLEALASQIETQISGPSVD